MPDAFHPDRDKRIAAEAASYKRRQAKKVAGGFMTSMALNPFLLQIDLTQSRSATKWVHDLDGFESVPASNRPDPKPKCCEVG